MSLCTQSQQSNVLLKLAQNISFNKRDADAILKLTVKCLQKYINKTKRWVDFNTSQPLHFKSSSFNIHYNAVLHSMNRAGIFETDVMNQDVCSHNFI